MMPNMGAQQESQPKRKKYQGISSERNINLCNHGKGNLTLVEI